MTILITGVAGFIGSHIARKFVNTGFKVVGVDYLSSVLIKNIPEGVKFIRGNLSDPQTIKALPKNCKIILHLAGQSSGQISFEDPIADLQKNTISTLNLVKYGIESGAKKIIYASSMAVYGDSANGLVSENDFCAPISCYGLSKLTSEKYLHIYKHELPYISVRMFNVYGPGQDMMNLKQGMVSIFISQALQNGKIHVKGSLDRFRDFIYIDDVVDSWFKLAFLEEEQSITVNLGTGIKVKLSTLLQKIKVEIPEVEWFSEGSTPGDQLGIYADNKKLRSLCNVNNFTTLESGLKHFVSWARGAE